MRELIKGSLKPIIVDGDVPINNRIRRSRTAEAEADHPHRGNREADFELDFDDELSETGEPKETEPEPEPERPTIDLRELEELREHYKREGEEQAQNIKRKAEIELAHAKEDAEKIRQQAQNERMEKLRALDADAAKAMEKAKKDGFEIGYGEGVQKGTDDGYVQGLKKCKDTLLDLKSICEGVEKEKAALMAENRRSIFDMAMSVAEKITMAVFSQKDKQVLEKMIAEAAKEFRSAKSVRVSLSKLDLSEDVEADLKILEKCFSDTVQVEFEVLEDAERGTLLMETDSEILDAGVSTQLRMIEELGKGKFRDREPDAEEAEDIEEAVKLEKPKKTKKAEKPKEPETAEPEVAVEAAEAEKPKEPEKVKEPEVIEEPAEPEKAKEPKKSAEPKKAKEPEIPVQAAVEAAAEPVAEAAEPAAKSGSGKMSQEEIAALIAQAAAPVEEAAEAVETAAEPVNAAATEVTAEIMADEQEATEEQ